jgi:hypothetical protein
VGVSNSSQFCFAFKICMYWMLVAARGFGFFQAMAQPASDSAFTYL